MRRLARASTQWAPVALAAGLLASGLVAGCGGDSAAPAHAQATSARPARAGTTTTTSTAGATTTTSTTTGTASTTSAAPPPPATQSAGTLEPATALDFTTAAPSELNQVLPPFFRATSPWNTPVTSAGTDPASSSLLDLAARRTGVIEAPGQTSVQTQTRKIVNGLAINTQAWTVPVVADLQATPTLVWCRQVQCGPDAVGLNSLMVPPDVNPDPRYDGWFTVVDTRTQVAYDLWRARRQSDGSVSFQYVKRWPLSGDGFSAPYTVSARGSGLPLFAGLITRDELQRGVINHALAISVPGPAQRRFVPPASATDGVGDARSLPEGARIRLKASVHLPAGILRAQGRSDGDLRRVEDRRRVAGALLLALQRYGAIVVDRAKVPTLYAQRDVSGRFLSGDELAGVHLNDFEVVPLGRSYVYPRPGTSQVGLGVSAVAAKGTR